MAYVSWQTYFSAVNGGATGPTDDLEIATGGEVEITGTVQCRRLVLRGTAKLRFAPGSTGLLEHYGSVVLRDDAYLEALPASNAIVHTIWLKGANNNTARSTAEATAAGIPHTEEDPLTPGLYVLHRAMLNLRGTPKSPHTRLSAAAAQGATTLSVEAPPEGGSFPLNWKDGDRVVVAPFMPFTPGSRDDAFIQSDLTTLAADVTTASITIEDPLLRARGYLNRDAARMPAGWTGVTRFSPHVLNLTRNMIVRGDGEMSCTHVFISHCSSPQTLHYVRFEWAGLEREKVPGSGGDREEVAGRYAVHFHHCGRPTTNLTVNGGRHKILGCVGYRTRNRGFVTHATHGADYDYCTLFDSRSQGFWWDPSGGAQQAWAPQNASHDVHYFRCVGGEILPFKGSGGHNTSLFELNTSFPEDADDQPSVIECWAFAIGGKIGTNTAGFNWGGGEKGNWIFEKNGAYGQWNSGIRVWQNSSLLHNITDFAAIYCRGPGIDHGAYNNSYVYDRIFYYGCEWALQHHNSSGAVRRFKHENVVVDGAGLTTRAIAIGHPAALGSMRGLFKTWHIENVAEGFKVLEVLPVQGDPPVVENGVVISGEESQRRVWHRLEDFHIHDDIPEADWFWLASSGYPQAARNITPPYYDLLPPQDDIQIAYFRDHTGALISNQLFLLHTLRDDMPGTVVPAWNAKRVIQDPLQDDFDEDPAGGALIMSDDFEVDRAGDWDPDKFLPMVSRAVSATPNNYLDYVSGGLGILRLHDGQGGWIRKTMRDEITGAEASLEECQIALKGWRHSTTAAGQVEALVMLRGQGEVNATQMIRAGGYVMRVLANKIEAWAYKPGEPAVKMLNDEGGDDFASVSPGMVLADPRDMYFKVLNEYRDIAGTPTLVPVVYMAMAAPGDAPVFTFKSADLSANRIITVGTGQSQSGRGSVDYIVRRTSGTGNSAAVEEIILTELGGEIPTPIELFVIPTPDEISFSLEQGADPQQATISLDMSDPEQSETVAITTDQDWLSVSPSGLMTPGQVVVTVDPTGLAAGVYEGNVIIDPQVSSETVIPVRLTVAGVEGFPIGDYIYNRSLNDWERVYTTQIDGVKDLPEALADMSADLDALSASVVSGLAGKAPTVHGHTLSQISDAGTAAALNAPASGDATGAQVVKGDDSRLTNSRAPSGVAGGVLGGTFPNPSFAEDMATQAELNAHTGNTSNPHSTTKSQVGLGNVDNTSDANKPISTATATALASKADLVGGVIPTAQIPSLAITEHLGSVASQAAMLALSGQKGDWAIRTDLGTVWIITGNDPSILAGWTQLSYPTAPVTSVNGDTGVVVLGAADVGADPSGSAATVQTNLNTHAGNTSNPHSVTKAQVGLSNVPNTDATARANHTGTQAISTVTGLQTALDGKAATSHSHAIADTTGLQTALDAKAPLLVTVEVKTASYELVAGDNGKIIEMNVAGANNLTIPTGLPTGFSVVIVQVGAGQTTVVAAGGVTLRNPEATAKLDGQWSQATIYIRASNVAVLGGRLAAS